MGLVGRVWLVALLLASTNVVRWLETIRGVVGSAKSLFSLCVWCTIAQGKLPNPVTHLMAPLSEPLFEDATWDAWRPAALQNIALCESL